MSAMPCELDLVLTPHTSLSPTGFWVVMGVLVAANFVAGTLFLVLGAWPVLIFLGLDVALVYWAFRASYRRARRLERVRLDAAALTVERCDPTGHSDTVTFAPPHWLQVRLDVRAEGETQLVLTSHGRELVIGAFLAPEEREAAARQIRLALARLNRAQPTPSTSFMP